MFEPAFGSTQPEDSKVAIDETANQPRAGHAYFAEGLRKGALSTRWRVAAVFLSEVAACGVSAQQAGSFRLGAKNARGNQRRSLADLDF